MRFFSLVDELTGSTVDLDGSGGIYLADPSGLGLDASHTWADFGSGFFSSVNPEIDPQQDIGFDLIFATRSPYQLYREMVDWLQSAAQPVLTYRPYGGDVFRRRIAVTRIAKTEIDRTGWLTCKVSAATLTPWYKPEQLSINMEQLSSNAARFGSGRYDQNIFAASTFGFIAQIAAAGHLPAAIRFSFTGTVNKPTLRLTDAQSGRLIGEFNLDTSISGATLEYSSDPLDCYIRKVSGQTVTDLSDSVVPGTDAYFRIPADEDAILTFGGTGTPSGSAKAQIQFYYRSV